ncbi:hypothetical protein BDV11DRAFT_106745 [Aspergillus similis]
MLQPADRRDWQPEQAHHTMHNKRMAAYNNLGTSVVPSSITDRRQDAGARSIRGWCRSCATDCPPPAILEPCYHRAHAANRSEVHITAEGPTLATYPGQHVSPRIDASATRAISHVARQPRRQHLSNRQFRAFYTGRCTVQTVTLLSLMMHCYTTP